MELKLGDNGKLMFIKNKCRYFFDRLLSNKKCQKQLMIMIGLLTFVLLFF